MSFGRRAPVLPSRAQSRRSLASALARLLGAPASNPGQHQEDIPGHTSREGTPKTPSNASVTTPSLDFPDLGSGDSLTAFGTVRRIFGKGRRYSSTGRGRGDGPTPR